MAKHFFSPFTSLHKKKTDPEDLPLIIGPNLKICTIKLPTDLDREGLNEVRKWIKNFSGMVDEQLSYHEENSISLEKLLQVEA